MNLLKHLLGKEEMVIASPVKGRLVSIEEVPDETFSQEIIGKGVAIIPYEDKFYAPISGVVSTIFPTGHAIVMTAEYGAEILIHVGIDTVKLDGKYFSVYVKEGQKLQQGELLLEVNLAKIKEEGYNTITPILVCNSNEFSEINKELEKEITLNDKIISLKK